MIEYHLGVRPAYGMATRRSIIVLSYERTVKIVNVTIICNSDYVDMRVKTSYTIIDTQPVAI